MVRAGIAAGAGSLPYRQMRPEIKRCNAKTLKLRDFPHPGGVRPREQGLRRLAGHRMTPVRRDFRQGGQNEGPVRQPGMRQDQTLLILALNDVMIGEKVRGALRSDRRRPKPASMA